MVPQPHSLDDVDYHAGRALSQYSHVLKGHDPITQGSDCGKKCTFACGSVTVL